MRGTVAWSGGGYISATVVKGFYQKYGFVYLMIMLILNSYLSGVFKDSSFINDTKDGLKEKKCCQSVS